MAYIGNTVNNQGFTPAIDYFSGNGVTVTFTLSRPVVSVAQMIVAIDNVIQNPSSAFTVSGNSITFTSAPLAGTNNIWVEYTSLITTYNAISQDPSVIGDITATGGFLAVGDFGNTYTDGTIVDYVTGNARITTGPADGLTIYNGGTSSRTALMAIDSSGNVGIGTTSPNNYGGSFKTLQVTGGSTSYGGILRLTNSDSSRVGHVGVDSSAMFVNTATSTPIAFCIADAEKMRIDTSGNLGIGTNSPARKLQVYNNTNGFISRFTGGTSSDVNVGIYANTASSFGSIGTESNHSFKIFTNGNDAVTVDTTGRVTTPSQPGFNMTASSPTFTGTILPYTGTIFNTGSYFNTSTYTFTAPVAGIYIFGWQFFSPPNTAASVDFLKNGTAIGRYGTESGSLNNYTGWSGSMIINMAANDTAALNRFAGTIHLNPAYSYFCGYLLG